MKVLLDCVKSSESSLLDSGVLRKFTGRMPLKNQISVNRMLYKWWWLSSNSFLMWLIKGSHVFTQWCRS